MLFLLHECFQADDMQNRVDGSWKAIDLGHAGQGLEALKPLWKKDKSVRGKDSMVERWEPTLLQVLSARHPHPDGKESVEPAGAADSKTPPLTMTLLGAIYACQGVCVSKQWRPHLTRETAPNASGSAVGHGDQPRDQGAIS